MWVLYILHSTSMEEKFMCHSGQKHEKEMYCASCLQTEYVTEK